MSKLVQIINGVGMRQFILRGPRRWDFSFWLGRSRTLRVMLGGNLIR